MAASTGTRAPGVLDAPEGVYEDDPLFSTRPLDAETADGATHRDDAWAMLSHLKFEEDTPDERAELYRDQGNRELKINQRSAIFRAREKYTKAIEVPLVSDAVKSVSLANRAQAQIKLGNLGHAYKDALAAVKLDRSNAKAYYRASVAANRLLRHENARAVALEGLSACAVLTGSAAGKAIREQLYVAETALERREKAEAALARRKHEEHLRESRAAQILQTKGVKIGARLFDIQSRVEPCRPQLLDDGSITYPLMFVYTPSAAGDPADQEAESSDFVQNFHEDHTIREHLDAILPPPWDSSGVYHSANVEVLYRQKWTLSRHAFESRRAELRDDSFEDFVGSSLPRKELGAWISVNIDATLGKVLRRADYVTPQFPVFYIVPRGHRPA